MPYYPTDGSIGTELLKTHTFQKFSLGKTIPGSEGTQWVYVQASGAITAAGYVVVIDEAFQAAMLSTSNDAEGDLVGVAPVAFADDDYGWVQTRGPCVARVAANCAANVPLNTTSTAGQLDDDGGASSFLIEGLVLTTANGGAAATAAAMLNNAVLVSPTTITTINATTGNITTLNATDIDVGASGTVGTVDVFPSTAASGKTRITAADNAGDTTTTITNASQSGARTYTIPDAGASASFVMTEGAQAVNGVKTMASANIITHAPTGLKIQDSNASHLVTIAAGDESADRTLSIPVLGAGDTVMTLGTAQTVTGVKTHNAKDIFSAALNTKQAVTDVHDTTPTNAELETAFGGTAASLGRGFIGTIDDADGNTNGYIVWTSDASFYFLKGTKAT